MDKKFESSKPVMNRTRRQLIIGAGLAPLAVTLHSSKVFAQDGLDVGVSGAAPFSGVIEGSMGPDGQPGNAGTEHQLYLAINSKADYSGRSSTTLGEYYGTIGSQNDEEWVVNNNGLLRWTSSYETPFANAAKAALDKVKEIEKKTTDINAALPTVGTASQVNIEDTFNGADPAIDLIQTAKDLLPENLTEGTTIGVYKYVEYVVNRYTTAVANYNTAVANYNAQNFTNDLTALSTSST